MTTTPAVAPLSAGMDSILDKMEMIAQVVKGDRLPNTAKALSGLIAQARAATVACVKDARDAALEEAAEKLDSMNDSAGDAAAYDQREMYQYETDRMHAISDCADKIRALKSSATQEGK